MDDIHIIGKEIRQIAVPFKDTNLEIIFRANNTIKNILKLAPQIDKYKH
jgi:hypothetical protein